MINPLRIVFTLLATMAFCAAPASAGIVTFPKKAPILSFELPDGWRAEPDKDGDLKIQPAVDEELILLVAKLDKAKDADGARGGLPVVARRSCEGCGAKGVEVSEVRAVPGFGKKGDLTLLACEARGKNDAGTEFVITSAAVEVNKKFVLFVVVTTDVNSRKYAPDLEKLFGSLVKVK